MNIDKNRVFMSSAAVGGKESGPLGSRALRKVRKSNPTEWKLTLIDTLRTGFTVAVDGYTPATSNSINVNHRVINSGAVMTILEGRFRPIADYRALDAALDQLAVEK